MAFDMSDEIRRELDMNDRIREVLGPEFRSMVPSIVVVGNQSAGKSSLLESLSGLQLPRGTDTVTRMPVALKMRPPRDGEDEGMCTVEFGGTSEEVAVSGVEDKIRNITERECPGGGFSEKELSVCVRRRGVPPVTLIDLPGILYDGARTDLVKGMIMRRIKSENATILVVHNGQVEVSNTEAYSLAKEVDPMGARTMVAITFLDRVISDAAAEMVLPMLKRTGSGLPCVGVGLFCEGDLKLADIRKMSLRKQMEYECGKFTAHRVFGSQSVLPNRASCLGVANLGSLLQAKYHEAIQRNHPTLAARLMEARQRAFAEKVGLPRAGSPSMVIASIVDNAASLYDELLRSSTHAEASLYSRLFDAVGQLDLDWQKAEKRLVESEKFIERVKDIAARLRGVHLPDFKSFEPIEQLFQLVMRMVRALGEKFVKAVENHFEAASKTVAERLREKWVGPNGLYDEAFVFVTSELEKVVKRTCVHIHNVFGEIVELEEGDPATLNEHYYRSKMDTMRQCIDFVSGKKKVKVGAPGGEVEEPACIKTRVGMIVRKVYEALKKEPNKELVNQVLEYIMSLLALGTVSRKRFIDYLGLQVRRSARIVTERLKSELSETSPERARVLLPGLKAIEERRIDLEKQLHSLEEATRLLEGRVPELDALPRSQNSATSRSSAQDDPLLGDALKYVLNGSAPESNSMFDL